jgi:hypothetical protein
VFVPERYAVKWTGGNVIDWAMPATTAPGRGDTGFGRGGGLGTGSAGGTGGGSYREGSVAGGVSGTEETITVAGQVPPNNKVAEPSQNVVNLQQRTAGILPVRIDIPRAGTSHQFFKPLVVDQETLVNFSYRRR